MQIAKTYAAEAVHEHFRDMALAFLEASERLCDDLNSGRWGGSFNNGQVAMHLAFHATELFLKGCIRAHPHGRRKNLHSLGELLVEFMELYPTLTFEPPFGPAPVRLDPELFELAVQSDATLHQRFRYPTDTAGNPWPGVWGFSAQQFRQDLAELRRDFERIWQSVNVNDS